MSGSDLRVVGRVLVASMLAVAACGDDGGGEGGEGEGTNTNTNGDGPGTGNPNTAPLAADDTYVVRQDAGMLTIAAMEGVLANDSDINMMDVLSIVSFDATSAGGGAVTVNPDGSFTYTLPSPYWGPDTFTYTIDDGSGASSVGTVLIQVTPVAVDLGTVGGFRGFEIIGEGGGDVSGSAIASGGDTNGDGRTDIVIGASGAGAGGRVYVVFGKGNTDAVNLGNVAGGQGGFVINGEGAGDDAGVAVAGGSDANGDGLNDVIVGAPGAGPAGAGRVYVVFGRGDDDTSAVNLSAVAGGNGGFVIEGEAAGDMAGASVSGGGDINGDDIEDIVIGAPGAMSGMMVATGRAYVVFGRMDESTPVNLADVAAGNGGFVINGEADADLAGGSVALVGEVNDDGLSDVVVGAAGNGAGAGRAYVVFGKGNGTPVELSNLMGGFPVDGTAGGSAGGAVAWAGDVNNDGSNDAMVGAPGAGTAFIVFGKSDSAAVNLADVGMGIGGIAFSGVGGETVGSALSGAGDVDNDGQEDVIVGAGAAGRSYLIYGTGGGVVDAALIADGMGGFVLTGGSQAGAAVSRVGNVNDDNFDDFAVGAPGADGSAGRTYIVFGGDFRPQM